MRFVLGNRHLAEVGGTEVHLVILADHLRRLGHEAVIYSPELGAYAEHARRMGLDVRSGLRALPRECDVVFSQDTLVAFDLAERFPQALHSFRICGDVHQFQLPPQLDGVVDLIVVLSERYARLAHACAAATPVVRLRVPVDVDLRSPVGRIRDRPRRAVMLGNYGDRYELVRSVWGELGIEVEQVGAANGGRASYDVATALAGADIVVAKSRAALEAMSCGRAVYVYDLFGGDGWVTPELYPVLEADHFAGLATDRVIGPGELARDLADYDVAMGTANRDLILQHHNARDHVIDLLAAFEAHRAPATRPAAQLGEVARLTSLASFWEGQARELRTREGWLHDRVAHADDVAAKLGVTNTASAARAAELEHELAEVNELRATRAWRAAERYWLVKERLTGRRDKEDSPESVGPELT